MGNFMECFYVLLGHTSAEERGSIYIYFGTLIECTCPNNPLCSFTIASLNHCTNPHRGKESRIICLHSSHINKAHLGFFCTCFKTYKPFEVYKPHAQLPSSHIPVIAQIILLILSFHSRRLT